MKKKKSGVILTVCVGILITGMLTSCTGFKGFQKPDEKEKESESSVETEASAKNDASGKGFQKPSTKGNPKTDGKKPMRKLEEYVTLETTETDYGNIVIPVLSEEYLSEDAGIANEMFEYIRDEILGRLEEKKEFYSEGTFLTFCETKYTLNGKTLSVLVNYIVPDMEILYYYISVNFDIETGKAMNPHQIIKEAGYTEEQVKDAIRTVAEISMKSTLDEDEAVIQELLDDMIRDYEMEQQEMGVPWDDLPTHPTVFLDEDAQLSVCVFIPSSNSIGVYSTMVLIGKDSDETVNLNGLDIYEEPEGDAPIYEGLTEEEAYEIVSQHINADYKYSLMIDGTENIAGNDGLLETAYVIRQYTDEGDHIATVDWWAVGKYSGCVWKMDIINGGDWVEQ